MESNEMIEDLNYLVISTPESIFNSQQLKIVGRCLDLGKLLIIN